MKALADQSAGKSKSTGFAAKAKAAAAAVKDMAQSRWLTFRSRKALAKLGEAAYEMHGEQSGPAELVHPIARGRSQLQTMDIASPGTMRRTNVRLPFTIKQRLTLGILLCGAVFIAALGVTLVILLFTDWDWVTFRFWVLSCCGVIPCYILLRIRLTGKARLVHPIAQDRSQLQALNAESVHLSQPKPGQFSTLKWILSDRIAAIEVGCIAALLVLMMFLIWPSAKSPSSAKEEGHNVADGTGLPSGSGRRLTVIVVTEDMTNYRDRKVTSLPKFNASLSSVVATATEGELVIEFDIDASQWTGEEYVRLPLLVRLFDKNGEYLTHFTTAEAFTVSIGVFRRVDQIYQDQKRLGSGYAAMLKCALLKPKGNRLVYGVNIRDLRDASIVEIGFAEPRD
jgi:hypothetical protein